MEEAARKRLWVDYARTKDPGIREKIILEYAPLVKVVAGRLHMYLGSNVEYEELVSYGIFGLIDAIDKFDSLKDVKFETYGCGSAIASSSMATELIKGKTVEEAWELSNKAVAEALDGLPPVKMHCSVLAEQAIKAALIDYAKKNNIHIPELDGIVIDDDHDHHHDIEDED